MMKKIIKNPLFTFILGAIIFGGIVGVSAYTIFANDIGYTPKDTTWEVDNVKEAIDDLYNKANITSGEKLLKSLMTTISMTHNSNASVGKTGGFTWKNVDFSNIQSFNFMITSLSGATSDVGFSVTNISPTFSNKVYYFSTYQLNTNSTINMIDIDRCDFGMFVSIDTTVTFKVISYTTIDGVVHTS